MTLTDDDDLTLSLFKTKKQKKVTISRLGATPYASLMPPSEIAIRESRTVIRTTIFFALIVFAALTAFWAWSHLQLIDSNQKLISLREQNTEIIAKQARYSDTENVTGRLGSLETTKSQIDASKLDWAKLTEDIFTALPEGAKITDIIFQIQLADATSGAPQQIIALIQGTSNTVSLIESYLANLREVASEITVISQDSSSSSEHKFYVETRFSFDDYKEILQ